MQTARMTPALTGSCRLPAAAPAAFQQPRAPRRERAPCVAAAFDTSRSAGVRCLPPGGCEAERPAVPDRSRDAGVPAEDFVPRGEPGAALGLGRGGTALLAAGIAFAVLQGGDALAAAGPPDDLASAHRAANVVLGDMAQNEDFWSNVGAYARFFVTVMLGTANIMTKPFREAVKNPTSAFFVAGGTLAVFAFLTITVRLMLGLSTDELSLDMVAPLDFLIVDP